MMEILYWKDFPTPDISEMSWERWVTESCYAKGEATEILDCMDRANYFLFSQTSLTDAVYRFSGATMENLLTLGGLVNWGL